MGTLKGLCLIQWFLVVLGGWSRVQEFGIPKPSARSVHVAVFDPTINQFWIHGGSSDGVLPDLWSFDFNTGGTWDRKQQLNQVPSPRGDHVAVWDPDEYALWLHGGYDGVSYFDDLWRYSSFTWTNIMVGGPSARSQHVAVWDASNRAIWIHGGLCDCALKQDLWKFDTRQGTWSQMPESGSQPSARSNHVAAWDSANLALWIHAGYDRSSCGGNPQGGLQQDLWRYDTVSSNWNLIAMGGPSARAYHVAGWDPTNRALWIHGGFDGGSFCRDLWRFDVENYAWHLIADKDDGPSPRFSHAAAFDATTTSLCIHGGYSEGSLQDDLWCYLVTTTTTSRTASSSTTTSFSTSSTVTSTVTFTTTTSRSSTSTTSSTSRSSSSTSTLTTSRSTSTRSSTSSTTVSSSTSKSSTKTTSSTTSSSITATRSTSSTSTTSSTTVSTTTTSSHTETATTSTTTLSFTSTTTGSTTTTTSTSMTMSSTTTSSTTTFSSTSSTSISSSTTISRTTTTSHTVTTTSITLTTSTTSSTRSSTTTVTSTRTSSTTMSTTTSSTSTTTLSTTSTSSFSTTSSSISTSSTTGTSSSSVSFTTTTSTSITSTTSSITTTSTSLTISSSTSSTKTSSSSTQTTSTRTTRTTSSSTGTRTTSTSSTITTTTTAVEDLTAVYILFPLVGLAVIITTMWLLWWYLRYLRLKRAIVVPLQPFEQTVETVLTIAPPPPECLPTAPECQPPYPPHPPEPPDPPDCHPPPMNFQVLQHPPALPLPCPPHPGRLPQQPPPLPDLTHLESLPQRSHLCINIPGPSRVSPQRPVSIDQCPVTRTYEERPAPRIVPMSPRSPRLRRLREPLPTEIQPPLQTPPSRPSGASCNIVSLQPEPLLEPNLQEQMVCNCIVLVPALGEPPCLNSDWWSASQEPCSQFYGENQIASIDPSDMWPRLDHVLLIAKGQQDGTEAPSLLRGHGEVCTAAARRSLPDVQPAPILNEPAQNPTSRSCGDATPLNRRRRSAHHRPGRQDRSDRMPGPGFYNTEPDPNQYGWIPGRQPAFPRERRRYS